MSGTNVTSRLRGREPREAIRCNCAFAPCFVLLKAFHRNQPPIDAKRDGTVLYNLDSHEARKRDDPIHFLTIGTWVYFCVCTWNTFPVLASMAWTRPTSCIFLSQASRSRSRHFPTQDLPASFSLYCRGGVRKVVTTLPKGIGDEEGHGSHFATRSMSSGNLKMLA